MGELKLKGSGLRGVVKENWSYGAEELNSFMKMINKMLVWYPADRLSAKELLKCKFLE